MNSIYRRPLPEDHVAFASDHGRQLFAEALQAGTLQGYFRLAQQFHTQAEPAFCSLGSLVVALNALDIDPGRTWQGPWRWFSEELLNCCVSHDDVRARGMDIEQLATLAWCNGARSRVFRPRDLAVDHFRERVAAASRSSSGPVIIVNYDRAVLGQTGSGHYSPLGGYHEPSDRALVLDVARFKYPPHWVDVDTLWRAMLPIDESTGQSRGWIELEARSAEDREHAA